MKKVYEIHDLTTAEILADNLNFDDVPELFKAYQDFYSNHEMAVFCRENSYIKCANSHKQQEFKAEWFALIEANLCNIY